jgi:hypothetical protein
MVIGWYRMATLVATGALSNLKYRLAGPASWSRYATCACIIRPCTLRGLVVTAHGICRNGSSMAATSLYSSGRKSTTSRRLLVSSTVLRSCLPLELRVADIEREAMTPARRALGQGSTTG